MSAHIPINKLTGSALAPPKRPTDADYQRRISVARSFLDQLQAGLDDTTSHTSTLLFAELNRAFVWLSQNGQAKQSSTVHVHDGGEH